jgi:hypothetical protein
VRSLLTPWRGALGGISPRTAAAELAAARRHRQVDELANDLRNIARATPGRVVTVLRGAGRGLKFGALTVAEAQAHAADLLPAAFNAPDVGPVRAELAAPVPPGSFRFMLCDAGDGLTVGTMALEAS